MLDNIKKDNIIKIDNNIEIDLKRGNFMKKDFVSIIMNPARQRIVQYLILHGQGTVGEIAEELSDIPRPSLYRHIRILAENGCVEVSEERAVRGAVEKTYRLVAQPMGDHVTQADIAALIQGTLLSVMASFAQYFQRPEVDPQKDMLSVSSSTLMLTDQEFMEMLGKIGGVYNGYISNGPGEGRRPRSLTFISAPAGGGEKGAHHA